MNVKNMVMIGLCRPGLIRGSGGSRVGFAKFGLWRMRNEDDSVVHVSTRRRHCGIGSGQEGDAMNDERVEREARTLYESHYADKPNLGWKREPRWMCDDFTQQARAALEAALGIEGDE